MSLTCGSHMDRCTVRNALTWGMCGSHWHQYKVQSSWNDRIVHLVLAILEAIPVLGQITSLIELKMLRKYERPSPPSCIPSIQLIKHQETPDDPIRYWPEDLTLLGLNQEQKKLVDLHVKEALRIKEFSYSKKKLEYNRDSDRVVADLPISLVAIKIDNTIQILLFPKTVFAKGGERKIRWAYNLTSGEFLLKKRIVGACEKSILQLMHPLRRSQGFPVSTIWRQSNEAPKKTKLQIIEPIRNGVLSDLFGKKPLSQFSTKQTLIRDLLRDLLSLHSIKVSNIIATSNSQKRALEPYQAFHADIKLLNVLFFLQNGKYRAEMTDFGNAAANPVAWALSTGWTPPEYLRFFKKFKPDGFVKDQRDPDPFRNHFRTSPKEFDPTLSSLIDFNLEYGPGRDVWSMGLVLLSLLMEKTDEGEWEQLTRPFAWEKTRYSSTIAPLPSLKKCFSNNGAYPDIGLCELKQEAIDADLALLQKEATRKHPDEKQSVTMVFDLVRQMLKLDPSERITTPKMKEFLDSWEKSFPEPVLPELKGP